MYLVMCASFGYYSSLFSRFIIRESSNRAASEAGETSSTGQLDGLDLIDSHPTIDLMQVTITMSYFYRLVGSSAYGVFGVW